MAAPALVYCVENEGVTTKRPFRFTLQGSRCRTATEWLELARKAEDLGYGGLGIADHLDDQLGPIAALTAAALVTDELLLGAMVFCNDLRHPAVLAKELATLDQLSDGRLRVALGAGWMTEDYAWSGIPLDRPGTRIERLAEAIAVVRGLFADGPFTFHGAHYDIEGLDGQPKPQQRPHPPIILGGGGRRMLTLAAQQADVIALNVALPAGVIDARVGPDATAEATDRKLGWIRDAAGPRFNDLIIQARIHVGAITDDRDGLAEVIGQGLGLSAAASLESPFSLAGDVDQLVDVLQERRERWGISEIGLSSSVVDDFAPVVARLAGT